MMSSVGMVQFRFRGPARVLAGLAIALAFVLAPGSAPATTSPPGALDRGFQQLYNLDFTAAEREFVSWEKVNPQNPMGPVSEAAGILFSEFNRLGVLESQFYENDSMFAARQKHVADPKQRARFEELLTRGEGLARTTLARDSRDRDALLAMTLVNGLRADYAALIEKRNLPSLHFTKESSTWADQLLAADPTCYDAHLAGGISKYIVGSMAAPVRWFLRLGGVSGDKQRGISELQLTAAQGRFLAPFARILLAIAYVRDKQPERARPVLLSLEKDFPNNPLFARELARLEPVASR
jgi:hypothetical protein